MSDLERRLIGREAVRGQSNAVCLIFACDDPLIIPIEAWVDESLKIGEAVDDAQWSRLKQYAAVEQAKGLAFRHLASKRRTVGEVARYLARKDVSQDIVATVIERLKSAEYLDDAAYVEDFVNAKKSTMSRRELTWRLRRRGISSDISMMGAEIDSEQAELQAAKTIAEKYWRTHSDKPSEWKEPRLIQHLERKGFPLSVAIRTAQLFK